MKSSVEPDIPVRIFTVRRLLLFFLLCCGTVICITIYEVELGSVFSSRLSLDFMRSLNDGLIEAVGLPAGPRKVRLLCLVVTYPKSHETKAKTIMETWGQRCTYIHFITTQDGSNSSLPLIYSPAKEAYMKLWAKTKFGFQFAYEFYRDKADWVLKADDDTYVVVENLVTFVENEDPNVAQFYGCHFRISVAQGYMSGGAGYILSRKAVEVLVQDGLTNSSVCKDSEEGYEDVEVGRCMEKLGIKPGNSRDDQGGERFHPLSPIEMVNLPNNSWLFTYMAQTPQIGMSCCSSLVITFHYVNPDLMRTLEYLIYKVRVVHPHYMLEKGQTVLNTSLAELLATTTATQVGTTNSTGQPNPSLGSNATTSQSNPVLAASTTTQLSPEQAANSTAQSVVPPSTILQSNLDPVANTTEQSSSVAAGTDATAQHNTTGESTPAPFSTA